MEGTLTILGSGSALPTFQNSPSGQIVTLCDKSFLIDCGEGIQLTMRQMGIKTARLYSIFISHLHGDHCFGLIGLISTLDMMGRTQPLHIYAHPDLEKLLRPWLDYHCKDLKYELIFHPLNPRKKEVVFEDRTITVETIPLKHKVPCCGFLFIEHHRRKNTETGELTYESRKRYAYCSDTMYKENIVPQIEGVDMLFHESTFIEEWASRCKATMHSTAKQAATIALKAKVGQLVIGHYSSRTDDHSRFLSEAQEVFENTILAVERESYPILCRESADSRPTGE
ncbi:MAG: ribonuclease Z [Paludibacteraceae bacterium]|nr:ribonuclease Z [Paludibacteraceae bacterium]